MREGKKPEKAAHPDPSHNLSLPSLITTKYINHGISIFETIRQLGMYIDR
jgi:hypothetical protein